MITTMERSTSLPLEMMDAEQLASHVLGMAEPLRSDAVVRNEFYDNMGVVRTELTPSDPLNGNAVWLKDETRQLSGSYKQRGATLAVMNSDPSDTFVTYSTGNHGTSVALAAGKRGQKTVVETPKSLKPAKHARLEDAGAIVHRENTTFLDAENAAVALGEEPGYRLVRPFGDIEVIAGQCSVGHEIVEDLIARGLANSPVVVPVAVAGGGHIAGIAVPIWQAKLEGRLGPNVHVVGVQPEGTDAMRRAQAKIKAGEEPVNLFGSEGPDKDCDALAITEASLSPLTMTIASNPDMVQCLTTISKADLGRAMVELSTRLGKPVEPAAALPFAFASRYAKAFPAGKDFVTFVLPVSGGNVSEETLRTYETAVKRDDFGQLSATHLSAQNRPSPLEEVLSRPCNAVGNLVLQGTTTRSVVPVATAPSLMEQAGVNRDEVRSRYMRDLAALGIEFA